MEQRIHNLLDSIHFEAMQEYANLKIFPFISIIRKTLSKYRHYVSSGYEGKVEKYFSLKKCTKEYTI